MRRPADLTTSNWTDPPHNRWGFWHVPELTKTARISRGNGPVTALPPHWVSLDHSIVTHEGREYALRQFLEDRCHQGSVGLACGFLGPSSCDVWSRAPCIDEALDVSVRSN